MKMKLLGIEGVDYTKSDGTRVTGVKLYVCSAFSATKQNVKGMRCDDIWISGTSELYHKVLTFPCPSDLNVDYELDGRFTRLADITLIKS